MFINSFHEIKKPMNEFKNTILDIEDEKKSFINIKSQHIDRLKVLSKDIMDSMDNLENSYKKTKKYVDDISYFEN